MSIGLSLHGLYAILLLLILFFFSSSLQKGMMNMNMKMMGL